MSARILVFTPTWIDPATSEDAIRPECAASIQAQCLDDRGVTDFDWHVTADNPFPVGDYRNVLHQYQQARAWFLNSPRYAALITVEHDNVLTDEETFQKMWRTPGDVIYAPYRFRRSPLMSTYRYSGDQCLGDSLSLHPRDLNRAITIGIYRVSGAGFGCTLFRRSVLEAIEFRASLPTNPCPDLGFAEDALHAGLVSTGCFETPVLHLDGRSILHPWIEEEAETFIAKRSKAVLVEGRVIRLRTGQPVTLAVREADLLLQAGYVDE